MSMNDIAGNTTPGSAIIVALQNNGKILGTIQQALVKMFPQLLGTATSATGGSATLPANPVGFLTVTNPVTGATVKIPYYNT